MIENYGHIPNGNRTYYLSRSQPPVFALMVELFEEDGVRGARRYLDHLKMEYAFWMDGAESLIPNQAYRHSQDQRSAGKTSDNLSGGARSAQHYPGTLSGDRHADLRTD
ncbi:hypothetical protein BFX89_25950 [Escherichia coli]|nr:hypothetical protein BFX89_25950 [Escherichia coli]